MDSSIKFNVSANTAQFQSGMKQVDVAAKSTAAGIKQAFSGVQTMLIGTAALAGLKSMMNDFDKVAKVATRFGASAEDIQRVSVAADLAGTSIDTVARSLTKISVAASDATSGNQAMAESFAKAGINAEQFKNAGLDEQLIMLSEAFNRARGSADSTNQIIELMGTRAAGQMIPLIDNTEALRAEMEAVAVASDDVVRSIEAANDRLTRVGNTSKVFFAQLLGAGLDSAEKLGSSLAEPETRLKSIISLFGGPAQAVRGLYQMLQTGKTIKEMEEIEARANAINQLTREGALGGKDAGKNAALIAERTKQILDQMSGMTQQIRTAEDLTENVLEVEKEKTSELAKQAEQLARQEASRQNAIRDIRAEVALMEARLTGNKELEESLLKQADFNAAFETTGSTEDAENFAANKAAERAALAAAQSRVPGGGGIVRADPNLQSAMDRIREAASKFDVDAMTEESRISARGARGSARADELEDKGMHRSAAQARAREERHRERSAEKFEDRQAKNARREELEKMGPLERSREEKKDRELASEQERMAKEGSKTEKEREREEEESGGGGKGKDSTEAVATKLDTIIKEIMERLPIRVLAA